MARFKYMGEPARQGLVIEYGPCTKIKVPEKNGTVHVYVPVPPNTDFPVGEDIGYDITDERSVRYLQVDTRFQQIS